MNKKFEELLTRGLEQLNIEVTGKILEKFQAYYELLTEKNKVMNLTAITGFDEVIKKHFLDSLSVSEIVRSIGGMKIIDIGTGAGFPGIPLKIVYPDTEILLLDSLNKRINFLSEVIEKLELKNIRAVHARAEEYGHMAEHREKYDLAVSRAVARFNILSEYALPFVKVGGFFAAYKSQRTEEELDEAVRAVAILGGSIRVVKNIKIFGLDADRKIVLVEKESVTPVKYPRMNGKISKEPL